MFEVCPRRVAAAFSALALLFAATLPAAAQTATLVKDIATQGSGSSAIAARQITLAQGKIFFATTDLLPVPWVSDGTQAGTRMLTEEKGVSMIGALGGVALWSRYQELWRSDGTQAGTWLLQDPAALRRDGVFFGGAFLAFGCGAESGCGLWRTDGTVAGTRLLKNLLPEGGSGVFGSLTVAGSHVFFGVSTLGEADGLWVTDGTAAGTLRVAGEPLFQTPPFDGRPHVMTAAGDRVFFLTSTVSDKSMQLWTSDGTAAGTRMLTHLPAAASFGSFFQIQPIGSRIYFIVDDAVHGQEIWRSDGTVAGTRRITDFSTPQPFPSFDEAHGVQEVAHGRVVFLASDGIHPGTLLWKTDGDPGTTALVQCAGAGPCPGDAGGKIFAAGQRAVFVAREGNGAPAVWGTDGTPSGTVEVFPSCDSCFVEESLQTWPQGVSFVASDPAHGQEIWISDGTRAGTKRLTDLPGAGDPFAYDNAPVAATDGHKVVFEAKTGDGFGLWIADAAGTRLLAALPVDNSSPGPLDLLPFAGGLAFTVCHDSELEVWSAAAAGVDAAPLAATGDSCSSYPFTRELTPVGSLLYYLAGGALWRTDGTQAAAQLTSGVSVHDAPMTGFQGKLYFTLYDANGVFNPVVWKSDGTPEGTSEAFRPGGIDHSANISALTAANGALWFGAAFDSQPYKLWRSDGTPEGTRQIAGPASIDPTFAPLGSQVFFFGGNGSSTSQLWKTDGSDAGTALVDASSNDVLYGSDLTAYQGRLYFVRHSRSGGTTLWSSDGTAQGTLALRDFTSILTSIFHPGLTGFGDRVYFAADDGIHGRELWSTDGTVSGTVLVKDIAPGAASSSLDEITAAGGRLWFTADDGVHGAELWQSDGTEAGTRLAQDIAPGPASSAPRSFTVSGDRLWFAADDGATGREVWSLPLTDPGTCHPSLLHLCLGGSGGGRYQVEAVWRTADGTEGRGTAVSLSADTGYFWFFSPTNVEAVVKVLDGTGVNGHVWVFYGALSNVEYWLTVTDTQTGLTRRYFNPQGQLASVGDVHGFGPLGAYGANPVIATVTPPSPQPLIAERQGKAAAVPCQATAQQLCLNGGRFAVTVTWKDFQGHTGQGTAVPLSGDTGTFWFFNAANVELVVKALDGRPVNNHFWLFYGALSNVEYTLTVTDTQTGTMRTYTNPSGRFASVADTLAFE